MAAMISSISTDSGLLKLDEGQSNTFSFGSNVSNAKLVPGAGLTCSELPQLLPRCQSAQKTRHCGREPLGCPGLLLCSCDESSLPGHIFGSAPSEGGRDLVSLWLKPSFWSSQLIRRNETTVEATFTPPSETCLSGHS